MQNYLLLPVQSGTDVTHAEARHFPAIPELAMG